MQWALNDQIMVKLYLKEEVIRTCWHFTFLQTWSDRLPVESCLSLKTLDFKVAGTLSDFMASLDIFQSCLFSSLKKFNWHHFVELVMFTVISDLNPPHSAAAFLSVCTTADRTRTVWQHHAWGHGNLPVNVTSVWVNLHKLDFFLYALWMFFSHEHDNVDQVRLWLLGLNCFSHPAVSRCGQDKCWTELN